MISGIGDDHRQSLSRRFLRVRARSEALAAGLSAEDMAAQSMTEASPTKWHLAHTTWFFATFIEGIATAAATPVFAPLFNSYYESVGRPFPRPRRGLLTRPSLAEVMTWRAAVTEEVALLVERADERAWAGLRPLLALGIAHEEQHQELILTDLLHLFAQNPLLPAAIPFKPAEATAAAPLDWTGFAGGVFAIGHDGEGFAFDNEGPRHRVLIEDWRLASRLVTNREYRAFIADGGYRRSELWLSEGWSLLQAEGWAAPLYWRDGDDAGLTMGLAGPRPIEDDAPVVHVSFYEADAFARWAGKRLPTEAEWELAARGVPLGGNDAARGYLRPLPVPAGMPGPAQMFGDAWEWTASPYAPYPGFRAVAGALGEYNGKFMINQMVLRGSSCVTAEGHARPSYRNFFPPAARWQFSGIRLAEDA